MLLRTYVSMGMNILDIIQNFEYPILMQLNVNFIEFQCCILCGPFDWQYIFNWIVHLTGVIIVAAAAAQRSVRSECGRRGGCAMIALRR